MLTYLARPRGFYTEPPNATFVFPCQIEVVFTFHPSAPFGDEGPVGRMVPLGANARISWNACKGETSIITDAHIEPLEFTMIAQDCSVIFLGSSMTLTCGCDSRDELQSLLETYYYTFPAILGLTFLDTPIISEVRGKAGDIEFCWGLWDSSCNSFDVITEEIQEERILTGYKRLQMLEQSENTGNRRLLAAVQYFHIACRLSRSGNRRWEFLAETLLNYAKCLEALFPSPPQKSIDTVRNSLRYLGFTDIEIEALYIPALALRNSIDVAHPTLMIFTMADAAVLHSYADTAEDSFRLLLHRLFELIETENFSLDPLDSLQPSNDTQRIVRRIAANLDVYKQTQEIDSRGNCTND